MVHTVCVPAIPKMLLHILFIRQITASVHGTSVKRQCTRRRMEWVFQPQNQSSRMWGTLALRWKFHNIGSWIRRCEFYNPELSLEFYNPVSSSAPRCGLEHCNHDVNISENSKSEIYAHANCPKVQFGDRFSGAIGDMQILTTPCIFRDYNMCQTSPHHLYFFIARLFVHIFWFICHFKKGKIRQKYLFTSRIYQLWLCNRTIAAMIVVELMVMISKPRMYLCCLHSIVLKAQNCHIWWKSPLNDIVNTRGHWSLNYSYSLHITLLTTRGGQYWS